MKKTQQVFVLLNNDDVGIVRLVSATQIEKNVFVLEGPVPDGEEWEFLPGQFLECEQVTFSDGSSGLVAMRVEQ